MKKEHLSPEEYVSRWAKRISKLSAGEKNKVAETIKTIDKQLEIKRREKMAEEAGAADSDQEYLVPPVAPAELQAEVVKEQRATWTRLAEEKLHKKRLRKQCTVEIEMKKQLLAQIKDELEGNIKEEAKEEDDEEHVDIYHQGQSKALKPGFGVYLDDILNTVEEKTSKMKNINKIQEELGELYDK